MLGAGSVDIVDATMMAGLYKVSVEDGEREEDFECGFDGGSVIHVMSRKGF